MARPYRFVVMSALAFAALSPGLSGCTSEGSGIGQRSRLISDKHGQKAKPYQTSARIMSSIQALGGDKLMDFQVEELEKINASLGKELDVASQVYLKKIASVTGVKIDVLDKLRPQLDNQTIQIDKTVAFSFIEAKRQRKLSVQERDLLVRLDNQRRIDISHIHTRYAQQIAAVTGLPMPDIYGALIQPY